MAEPYPAQLARPLVDRLVLAALEEDLGPAGDITTQATLPPHATAKAELVTRQDGVVAGLDLVRAAFRSIDPEVNVQVHVSDGAAVTAGARLVSVSGNARNILSSERVALNFLNHLSGVATHTRRFVDAIAGTGARICDTRKTIPGLRAVEKYAVKCGGGSNHRFGLDDAILIKDNHIAVAGGVVQAVKAAQDFAGHLVAIEVEVDNLKQFEDALEAGATAVLLDNMKPDQLREAVIINRERAILEASGNVDLDTVAAIAASGVNYISTSKITMAAPPLDIGLDIELKV